MQQQVWPGPGVAADTAVLQNVTRCLNGSAAQILVPHLLPASLLLDETPAAAVELLPNAPAGSATYKNLTLALRVEEGDGWWEALPGPIGPAESWSQDGVNVTVASLEQVQGLSKGTTLSVTG